MAGTAFAAFGEAIDDSLTDVRPADVDAMRAELADAVEAFGSLRDKLQTIADNFDSEWPFGAVFKGAMSDFATTAGSMSDHAGELGTSFETDPEHEGRLDRVDNPKQGEGWWNVDAPNPAD